MDERRDGQVLTFFKHKSSGLFSMLLFIFITPLPLNASILLKVLSANFNSVLKRFPDHSAHSYEIQGSSNGGHSSLGQLFSPGRARSREFFLK